ncbi:MAG: hypothetical protein ACP5E3_05305 [Bacteroidales bacterium]
MNSGFDINAARKFQQNKLKKQQEELDAKFQQATHDFHAICEMIIRDFQPDKINLLEKKYINLHPLIIEDIQTFVNFLKQLSEA